MEYKSTKNIRNNNLSRKSKKSESYYNALDFSMNNYVGRLQKKERKDSLEINKKTMAIILACVVGLSSAASSFVTEDVIRHGNVVVPIDKETKDSVDQKISYYEELMGMTSDENNRIENFYGRDFKNNSALVDYNVNNLVKHLVASSQISESEMRCVIIAAYKIINEPYLDEVLNDAFLLALSSGEVNEETVNLLNEGTEGFLRKLSYENWEDYSENERNNIKKLITLEEYVGDKNGKTM